MEGLLYLLLFALLFYVMMRFGCGAHMIHGGHGGHDQHTAGSDSTDPVCGMEVSADSGYTKMYQSAQYRFCSRNCLDKFDANPQQYLKKEQS